VDRDPGRPARERQAPGSLRLRAPTYRRRDRGNKVRFPMPSEERSANPGAILGGARGRIAERRNRQSQWQPDPDLGTPRAIAFAVALAGVGRVGRPAGQRARRVAARGPGRQESSGASPTASW
jgi:hypothetical protein